MNFETALLLSELKRDIGEVRNFSEQMIENYTNDQLNTKPNKKSWSVFEVMEHLNRYGDYYLPRLNRAVELASTNGIETGNRYRSGWLGDYFTKGMLPKDGRVKNKMNTFKNMNPSYSKVNKDVVPVYLGQLKQMDDLCDRLLMHGGSKPRIPITISRWIRLKPIDTLRFSVAHSVRHALQMKNILNSLDESDFGIQ